MGGEKSRIALLAVLGLADPVSREAIVQRHRVLCKRLHPDRPGGDLVAFQRMQEAFEGLTEEAWGRQQKQSGEDGQDVPEWEWHPHAAHADWTQRDYDLYDAAWHNDLPTCLELLANGAQPDAYQNDVWGGTALMLAAQLGNIELVRALLRHGASPTRVDGGGVDARKWARRRKRWACLGLLEETAKGWTAAKL